MNERQKLSCEHEDRDRGHEIVCAEGHPGPQACGLGTCECCGRHTAYTSWRFCTSCARAKECTQCCGAPASKHAIKLHDFTVVLKDAADRVVARGSALPWTDHPSAFDLFLAISHDLSRRETVAIAEHLAQCPACRTKSDTLQSRFSEAQTTEEAVALMRRLDTEAVAV